MGFCVLHNARNERPDEGCRETWKFLFFTVFLRLPRCSIRDCSATAVAQHGTHTLGTCFTAKICKPGELRCTATVCVLPTCFRGFPANYVTRRYKTRREQFTPSQASARNSTQLKVHLPETYHRLALSSATLQPRQCHPVQGR